MRFFSSSSLASAFLLALLVPTESFLTRRPPSGLQQASSQRLSTTLLQASTLDRPTKINGDDSMTAAEAFPSTTKKDDGGGLNAVTRTAGVAAAAAIATAAVQASGDEQDDDWNNKQQPADSSTKSYIAVDPNAASLVDDDGLPLLYDPEGIQQYWKSQQGGSALSQRWGQFLKKAVPFLTQLASLWIRHGTLPESQFPTLAQQAVQDLQELGPTFVKLGQMMSVRPDVLPNAVLQELSLLQDAVPPFDTATALQTIEQELGQPIDQVFSYLSPEPVAAASLAQVHQGTLLNGTRVAVKVQRPDIRRVVSKDLYVLRRAARVVQSLFEQWAPQQQTDYTQLLNEWARGFYTELDFSNEASHQVRLKQILLDQNVTGVMVPQVYEELCTRQLLVSEWVDGVKLSACSPEQLAQVTPLAQEAFLTQLFDVGFFHADPHPGNILLRDEPTPEGHVLALIDCGLMASIEQEDREKMISAIVHLANKDYPALVDDFIKLEILPADSNRAAIVPLMDKALSPYVKGGGAKRYEAEVRKMYGMEDTSSMQAQMGGFQAMTQDALTVLNDIPFSIPPYFAILGRAIVTLEGVALSGNPDYGIIMESYPFIARKLLKEGRPEIQKALQQVLYAANDSDSSGGLKLTRLLALLNNAAGSVATQEGAAFVDLDAVPDDGLSFQAGLKFLLSDNAESLRNLLEDEVDSVVDIVTRQILRKSLSEVLVALAPPRPPSLPFVGSILPPPPALDQVPLPLLLPRIGVDGRTTASVSLMTLQDLIDAAAPELDRDEAIFAIGLAEGAREFFGDDVGDLIKGENVLRPESVQLLLSALRSGALGRSNVFSSDAASSVLEFAQTALNTVRQGSSTSSFEQELMDAISSLSDTERARFDTITTELTQRSIRRFVDRFSQVDRVL